MCFFVCCWFGMSVGGQKFTQSQETVDHGRCYRMPTSTCTHSGNPQAFSRGGLRIDATEVMTWRCEN